MLGSKITELVYEMCPYVYQLHCWSNTAFMHHFSYEDSLYNFLYLIEYKVYALILFRLGHVEAAKLFMEFATSDMDCKSSTMLGFKENFKFSILNFPIQKETEQQCDIGELYLSHFDVVDMGEYSLAGWSPSFESYTDEEDVRLGMWYNRWRFAWFSKNENSLSFISPSTLDETEHTLYEFITQLQCGRFDRPYLYTSDFYDDDGNGLKIQELSGEGWCLFEALFFNPYFSLYTWAVDLLVYLVDKKDNSLGFLTKEKRLQYEKIFQGKELV